MSQRKARILVLALGNELLGDDGVGLQAARLLAEQVGEGVDVLETAEAGLALLELMEGYECVLLLDSVMTRRHPTGTVMEFTPEDFSKVIAPSPHYAGLPEVLELARRLRIKFPQHVHILAIEVEDPYQFRIGLTERVRASLPSFVERAKGIVQQWLEGANTVAQTVNP